MTFTDWSQVVRFEVEQDPAGLANMIENPSGELGGAGWITPIAGSTISGLRDEFGVVGLKYVCAAAASNYFLSEAFPIAATQWAAASWYARVAAVLGTTTHRVRVDWLTAAMAANGSSAWTTSTATQGSTQMAPVQAPASTAFAQLRIEWAAVGGAFPNTTAGGSRWVRFVTVATAATAAELGTIRTNLTPNPSFEVNTTGWAVQGGCTLARSTTLFSTGVASLAITATGAAAADVRTLSGASGIPVSPGKTYTVQFKARAATVPRATRIGVIWYTTTGTQVSAANLTGPTDTTTGWTLVTGTFRAPAGATRMALRCGVTGSPAAGEVHRIDDVCAEVGDVAGDYFDGASVDVGTVTNDWTGTAHASSSRQVDTNLSFIEPITYSDILGDVSEVAVTREELNVGTLSLTVVNPLLDPSVETVLRPGRRYRLMAWNPAADAFEPLIVGRISNAKVDYFPLGKAGRTARVTLNGVDNVTALANAKRAESVGTITELRYVLEGAGVPWNVNGSSQQLGSATVVVRNDNTSALDLIALARDTERGYAWVDRWGVLQAWSTLDEAPSTEVAPNGAFATDTSGWNANVWTTLAWETGTAKLTSSNTTLGPRGASCTNFGRVAVEPGQRVIASAKVRSSTTVRVPQIILTFWDASVALVSQEVFTAAGSTSFVTVAGEVTVPYGAAEMSITVGVQDVNVSGEIHYIDDVSVVVDPKNPWQLTDAVYNPDIAVDYDTDRAINSVSVLRQWTHATQGVQGTLYGPYTDDPSIAEWGRHHVEINVAGTPAASIPAYAAAVLAANAQPERKCQSVTLPIDDEAALPFAFIDLYDAVRVVNAETNLDTVMRVTEISHSLVADERRGGRWLVTLGFATEGGVATPTQQPPLKAALATAPNGTRDHYVSASVAAISASTFEFVPGFARSGANPGWFSGPSSGVLTCLVAGTYLVTFSASFASNAAGRRILRILQTGTEVRRVDCAPPPTGGTYELVTVVTVVVGSTLTPQVWQSGTTAPATLALAASPDHILQLVRLAD